MNITLEKFKVFTGINETIDAGMSDWMEERAEQIIPIELKYTATEDTSCAILSYVEDPAKIATIAAQGFDVKTQEFKEIYASAREDLDGQPSETRTLGEIFEIRLNEWKQANPEKYILRMEFSVTENFMGALFMYMDAPNKEKVQTAKLKKKKGELNLAK